MSFHLAPVVGHLLKDLKRSDKLYMDETRCPVLDPGRGRTKTGFLWAIARDERPFGGSAPPGVVFCYADGRGGKHATDFLTGFSGTPQGDGYTGYNALTKPGRNSGPKPSYCADQIADLAQLPQIKSRQNRRGSLYAYFDPEGQSSGSADFV